MVGLSRVSGVIKKLPFISSSKIGKSHHHIRGRFIFQAFNKIEDFFSFLNAKRKSKDTFIGRTVKQKTYGFFDFFYYIKNNTHLDWHKK